MSIEPDTFSDARSVFDAIDNEPSVEQTVAISEKL